MKKWITRFDGTEYRFLSNFYPSPVVLDGETYATVEAAFQAAKTLDKAERKKIQEASSPAIAKKLGRASTMKDGWEASKFDVMLDLLRQKFSSGELRDKLVATWQFILVEGTYWHDNCWGVCSCPKCPGVGTNMLGTLLMQVRQEKVEEEKKQAAQDFFDGLEG